MNGTDPSRRLETWTQRLLLGFAFFIPITIAAGEALAYAVLALGVILLLQRRIEWPRGLPMTGPLFAFLAIAFVASLHGVRPLLSLSKIDRLYLVGLVLVIPALWGVGRDPEGRRMRDAVAAFLLGCSAQALYDVVHIPIAFYLQRSAWLASHPGVDPAKATPLLFNLGNMRDPQFYLVALCLLIALLVYRCWPARRAWLWLAAAVNACALVLQFKRGAWIAFLVAVLLMGLLTARRRLVLVVVLCAAALLAVPQVRDRLVMLKREKSTYMGGRLSLWTRVAPALIKEYPLGMGWKAPQHEDFKKVSRNVMPKLNHLHNNVLQLALEVGWAGAMVWLWWMGAGLVMAVATLRRARAAASLQAALAAGVLGGLCGLWANGMVEYNFGDAEIFMLMLFLLGLVAAQWWRRAAGGEPAA